MGVHGSWKLCEVPQLESNTANLLQVPPAGGGQLAIPLTLVDFSPQYLFFSIWHVKSLPFNIFTVWLLSIECKPQEGRALSNMYICCCMPYPRTPSSTHYNFYLLNMNKVNINRCNIYIKKNSLGVQSNFKKCNGFLRLKFENAVLEDPGWSTRMGSEARSGPSSGNFWSNRSTLYPLSDCCNT